MTDDWLRKHPDYFGANENLLDITCRPAGKSDYEQIAILAGGLLDKVFGEDFGPGGDASVKILVNAFENRLRHDCTWVMVEGDRVISVLDIETVETRLINGPPLTLCLAQGLGKMSLVEKAGLVRVIMHEPAADEAHQTIAAILPGSRGEGRGMLLLMHGAFWARAQGKNWVTTWLPDDNPFLQVYTRRGFFVERSLNTHEERGSGNWLFLKKPISSVAYRLMRQKVSKAE